MPRAAKDKSIPTATIGTETDFGPEFAGFVLANGSMSSSQSGEGDIRRALMSAELVACMVALPGQLFYSTQIPGMFQKAA